MEWIKRRSILIINNSFHPLKYNEDIINNMKVIM